MGCDVDPDEVSAGQPNDDKGMLLKLGFEVAQSSVAKYMVKRCGPPSQGWCTFLRNHAPDIAAMDLFVVPSIGFDLLYGCCSRSSGRHPEVAPGAKWRPNG
jgi:hypothetical protein